MPLLLIDAKPLSRPDSLGVSKLLMTATLALAGAFCALFLERVRQHVRSVDGVLPLTAEDDDALLEGRQRRDDAGRQTGL